MIINQINIKPILNKISFKSTNENRTTVDQYVQNDYFTNGMESSQLINPVEQFYELLKGGPHLTDEQIIEINKTKIAPENMSFAPEQILKKSWNRYNPPLWINTGNYIILHNETIKLSTNKALDKMKISILPEGFKVEKNPSGIAKVVKINQNNSL